MSIFFLLSVCPKSHFWKQQKPKFQPVYAIVGGYVVSCNQIPRQEKEDLALETAGNKDFDDTWLFSLSFLLFILGFGFILKSNILRNV